MHRSLLRCEFVSSVELARHREETAIMRPAHFIGFTLIGTLMACASCHGSETSATSSTSGSASAGSPVARQYSVRLNRGERKGQGGCALTRLSRGQAVANGAQAVATNVTASSPRGGTIGVDKRVSTALKAITIDERADYAASRHSYRCDRPPIRVRATTRAGVEGLVCAVRRPGVCLLRPVCVRS